MFDLAGSYDMCLEENVALYLSWVASNAMLFCEKFDLSVKFAVVYESNVNEKLEEYMECQSSRLFGMGNMHL